MKQLSDVLSKEVVKKLRNQIMFNKPNMKVNA